jgi:hypothetical protein
MRSIENEQRIPAALYKTDLNGFARGIVHQPFRMLLIDIRAL